MIELCFCVGVETRNRGEKPGQPFQIHGWVKVSTGWLRVSVWNTYLVSWCESRDGMPHRRTLRRVHTLTACRVTGLPIVELGRRIGTVGFNDNMQNKYTLSVGRRACGRVVVQHNSAFVLSMSEAALASDRNRTTGEKSPSAVARNMGALAAIAPQEVLRWWRRSSPSTEILKPTQAARVVD